MSSTKGLPLVFISAGVLGGVGLYFWQSHEIAEAIFCAATFVLVLAAGVMALYASGR